MTLVVGDQESVASLMELQSRHAALVELACSDSVAANVDAIESFIHVCEKAGHVLDCPSDRSSAQSLITYWVNRLARNARKVSKTSDDDADEESSSSMSFASDSSTSNDKSQGLLAEFDQDAFDQLVLVPTEDWVQLLSPYDQTLVRRIVLRLLTLRADNTFETVPNTEVIVEDLEPSDRALVLLESLVRLGVVRRQRHSLKVEEYTLQSLARLDNWPSLQRWMEQRKRFRNLADDTLIKQEGQASTEKIRPLVLASRFIRGQMTKFGAVLQRYVVRVPGLKSLYHTESAILTDEEMAEAEFYRDKNSVEAKAIYSKRQLERLKSETTQERLFGVTCALIILAVATTVAIVAAVQAVEYFRIADKTRRSNALFLSGVSLAELPMATDPSAALVRSLEAYADFEEAKTVIDPKLAQAWQESNLLSLGAAQQLAPVLVELIHRPQEDAASQPAKPGAKLSGSKNDTKLGTTAVTKSEKPTQTTALCDSGEVCIMTDLYLPSGQSKQTILSYRVVQKQASDSWKVVGADKLEVPTTGKKLMEPKVQVFIGHNGQLAAFVVSIKENGDGGQSTPRVGTYLFAGATGATTDLQPLAPGADAVSEPIAFRGQSPGIQTACFDRRERYLAVACEKEGDGRGSQTTVWSTANWQMPLVEQASVEGQITALAFSKETSSAQRGAQATSTIHLAAAVTESDNAAVIERLTLSARSGEVDAKSNASKKGLPPAKPTWQTFCKLALDTDSKARLIYCPTNPDLLFYSQDAQYYLIRTDLSQTRKVLLNSVMIQTESQKGLACSSVAFSEDGERLAVGLRCGKLALWQIEVERAVSAAASTAGAEGNLERDKGKKPKDTDWLRFIPLAAHPCHNEEVFGVRFSPDGKYLVSASRDKLVQVYDTIAQQLAAPAIVHHGTVNAANVTSDGRFVTAIARDIVFVWEFPTTRWLPKSFGIPQGRSIEATAQSTQGLLAVGGRRADAGMEAGWIRLLRCSDGSQINEEIVLQLPVKHLAVHPSGKWIFAIDIGGAAHLFQDSGKRVWSKPASDGFAKFGVFGPDPKNAQLLVCSDNRAVQGGSLVQIVRASDSNNTVQEQSARAIPSKDPAERLTVATFDPWGTGFAVGTSLGKMFYGLVDTESIIALTVNNERPHTERITHLAFNDQRRLLICGSEDDSATLWHLAKENWHGGGINLQADNSANINHIAISSTGDKFALASADGQAIVWQRNAEGSYGPAQKIKQAVTSQGAMLQVEFIQQPEDGRYLFCRWSDRSLRVFDTLHVASPLATSSSLLEGREVAAFAIPHSLDHAQVEVDAKNKWTVTASGHINLPAPALASDTGEDMRNKLFSWGAQVRLSRWVFSTYSPGSVQSDEALAIAKVISGRRVKDKLGQLESLQVEELLSLNKQAGSTNSLSNPKLALLDWHMREAGGGYCDAEACTRIAYEHFSKMPVPDETWDVQACLHYAKVLAHRSEFSKAREILERTRNVVGNQTDYLSLRAAINLCESFASATNQQLLVQAAIEDYLKILDVYPEDLFTRARLIEAYKRIHDTEKQQLEQLEEVIKRTSSGVSASNIKQRAALREKLGHPRREVLDDLKQAAELFIKENDLPQADGELMGAIALIKRNSTELGNEERLELASLYASLGDVWRLRNTTAGSSQNMYSNYLLACQNDPNNLEFVKKFCDSLDTFHDVDYLDSNWEKTDEVFQRALALDKSSAVIHSQRINVLVPHRSSSLMDNDRLERAVAACKERAADVGGTDVDQLNLAAIYVHMGKLDEAEKLLRKSHDEYPDVSLIGVRLGLVLAMRGNVNDLQELIKNMMDLPNPKPNDLNNVAWTAAYHQDAVVDQAKLLEMSEKAAKNFSTDPIYLNTLGGMYMRAGNLEKTLATLSLATSQRDQLPDYEVAPSEKKLGQAMDLVLMCLAQLTAKNSVEAAELLSRSESRFREYESQSQIPDFFSRVWNVHEYELFAEEAKRQQE